MTEIKINVSELKSEGEDVVKELVGFIREKTNAAVDAATDFIIVKGEEGKVSKKYLRVLLKKFLHQIELKEYFRVISHEGSLMVKEKKIEEEE